MHTGNHSLGVPVCTECLWWHVRQRLQRRWSVPDGYLQPPRALSILAACDARRPQRPVHPFLGNCCSASPTCCGSAWPPHALPPDPGPAEPGGPSTAGFRTGRKEGQIQCSTDKDNSLSGQFNKVKTLHNTPSPSVKHSVQLTAWHTQCSEQSL